MRRRPVFALSIVVLLRVALIYVTWPPSTWEQTDHEMSMQYFVNYHDVTNDLIPETPNSTIFWLYSDNCLAALVVFRYTPQS